MRYRADNIEKAGSGIPSKAFSILLSHTPEIYQQAAHADFSLLLSGHPHGGQICLPGGIPITLDSALPRHMGSGSCTTLRKCWLKHNGRFLLNGIEDVISRPDLGDRAIFLTLASIADTDRRPETELWREFRMARPRILGALLDAVVHGLRAINHVQLDELPRMADFALWAAALRNRFLARRDFRSRLYGQSQGGHREHYRSRPARHLRAHDHERKDQLERQRVRPLASLCPEGR
jgi:hypothetical protein